MTGQPEEWGDAKGGSSRRSAQGGALWRRGGGILQRPPPRNLPRASSAPQEWIAEPRGNQRPAAPLLPPAVSECGPTPDAGSDLGDTPRHLRTGGGAGDGLPPAPGPAGARAGGAPPPGRRRKAAPPVPGRGPGRPPGHAPGPQATPLSLGLGPAEGHAPVRPRSLDSRPRPYPLAKGLVKAPPCRATPLRGHAPCPCHLAGGAGRGSPRATGLARSRPASLVLQHCRGAGKERQERRDPLPLSSARLPGPPTPLPPPHALTPRLLGRGAGPGGPPGPAPPG
ncbi:basic proline-rich protein-like [Perognathus longimembris pacificus]|uniref:basic proline-rich protein-like n=1 Tax=Perognathus longimembris pacificus TaxID=214514 RepID=UPI002019D0F0|nr:basic proline-rich protein-like [Perognathus longimembris pacificus]